MPFLGNPNPLNRHYALDHFKRTNDIYGHPVGDQVLCRFAAVIRKYARTGVDAFRLGGEEFAIVMSRMTEERAYDLASKIGVAFGTEIVPTPLGPLRSTVSGGIGFGEADGSTLDEVLARADSMLYAAKRAGRNCVISRKGMDKADPVKPALRSA
ncbi:GGDEF domain-containing protein [Mesorhizobium sp. Cs1321R2N1]|uniref:GGDEF domain-containing protein n=1 Tax=Mesorhizobium sp. Cs1321R2N1 TaxID=3015174 RepID=UPI00301B900A